MKRICMLLALLAIGHFGWSQTAASYGFSAFSSSFSSIAATGTPIPALSDDDVTVTSIPIGFSFSFCGTSYTSLSACSNGWLSLNNSTFISPDNVIAFMDGPGWLMPWWDDLDGFFTGTAYYTTTGTAPSRVFTIEWNTYESFWGSGDATFQVKLHETSNIIDFCYGTSTYLSDDGATIGIANDAVSDWQTLSDAGASPSALASPTFETGILGSPAPDQVYRWTPAALCTLPAPIAGTLTTCPGSTTALTHDTTGGTWTTGSPLVATVDGATGVVSGLAAGTADITYTAPSGCYATAEVTVTAVTPVIGTFTVCTGYTTALTHGTPGGTWSSGDAVVADVSSSGLVTGNTAGTATISYELPGGCVASAVVTVSETPAAITGTLEICAGATSALATTSTGGTWSSSFMSVGTIDASGVVTGVGGGLTTISYTMPSGCYRTTTVTVDPLPAPISGTTSVCVSGTTVLSNSTIGGTWSSSDPAVASIDAGGTVTGAGAGTATITYTLASGCIRTTVVTVTAVVAPIVGTTTLCMHGPVSTLTCITPGGSWSSSDESIAIIGSTTGDLGWIAPGTATVTYTLASGCYTTTGVTVNPMELNTGTYAVCIGGSTTLSNTTPPLGTGAWSSADASVFTVGSSTGTCTGVGVGTADVTYTMPGTGCFITNVITVNPLPGAIAGNLHFCVGNTSALSCSPSGGTWSIAGSSAATVDAGTGIVTGASTGTALVTYTLGSGCTATAEVTVDPAPAAITGVSVLCPATSAFLSHTVPGGTWTSSDVAIATVGSSSGIALGVSMAGGTSTITYTLPSSGCTATLVVTVQPAPAPITGTQTVCVGTTTTLSTASLGATWSSGNLAVATVGSASGIVSGVTPGTATIVCHGANGCFRTTVVTVNANPSAITGTTTLCQGTNTTLSSTPGGGTWSCSNAAVGTVSSSGVVAGLTAGTSRISYSVASGCFVTTVVTVNITPTAITGGLTVCAGLTNTLSVTPSGGTWTSSSTAVAGIGASTGIVTGVAAGTSTISYTLANGCFRARNFTVNPMPAAITGASSVCPATNITLADATSGGTWSSSTLAVATVNTTTGVVTGVSGGTSTITYQLGTGCNATTEVTVIAAPVAAISPLGDTLLCPGDFVTLTTGAAPGVTYTWYNGGISIPGATSATYTTSASGGYQVRVTVTAGCTSISTPMSVTIMPATATITLPGGTTSTCAGSPILMNANTGVGLTYQWELGGTAISGATASSYSAASSGSYRVRVTNSAGCWALSSAVAITVNASPSGVVTLSGPLSFCIGNDVTMTAAPGTGYSYQWYNTGGTIPGATNASFTTSVAEDYHVVVTSGGCTATSATSTVVVNPLPDVTITPGSPLIFCSGGAVNLTALAGYGYQWYKGGVAIAGATNSGYIASASGGYRVRVTNIATGCTDMTHADTIVHVVGTPAVSPATSAKFCWGGGAMLSTSVSGLGSAVSYQWYVDGTVLPGATNGTHMATVPGTYHCDVSVPLSCTVSSSDVVVSEVPLPDPVITYNGVSLATGNAYITYQWYKDLVAISGATGWNTPAIGNGNYKVAVTDTNGCQSFSATYELKGWTGVSNVNTPQVRIYPNPTRGIVHISCDVPVTVTIAAVDGRQVLPVTNAKDINTGSLADGVYILSVYDADQQLLQTTRLIKTSE